MQRSLFAVALVLGLAVLGCDSATDDTRFFQASLAGSNEVPPVSSGGNGTCGFQLEGDTITFSIEAHGLSNVIGAHIHVGPSTGVGPVRVVLWPEPGGPAIDTANPVASVNGILKAGSFNNAHVTGGLTFADIVNQMQAGNTYCNVHTTRFPSGEIRGQIGLVNVD
ncbi:MAG TPA: CHRD domain-containing protein [Vicinamibacteria bacterium]|nr:CHRD domain-containing protein [Vicinamibacteria bacterium]